MVKQKMPKKAWIDRISKAGRCSIVLLLEDREQGACLVHMALA